MNREELLPIIRAAFSDLYARLASPTFNPALDPTFVHQRSGNVGICLWVWQYIERNCPGITNYGNENDIAYEIMYDLYDQWPDCACDEEGYRRRVYPIPLGQPSLYSRPYPQWIGDQLDARRRLVKFCVSLLENTYE